MDTKTKVLIVEDNADLRYAVSRALQFAGYDVVLAGDAVGAVSSALHEHPDLVLLDLGLPGGGGVGVLEHFAILPALCEIPVVVLSGRDPKAVEATVRHQHVAGFLRKPASRTELVDAIERALDGELEIRSTTPTSLL